MKVFQFYERFAKVFHLSRNRAVEKVVHFLLTNNKFIRLILTGRQDCPMGSNRSIGCASGIGKQLIDNDNCGDCGVRDQRRIFSNDQSLVNDKS